MGPLSGGTLGALVEVVLINVVLSGDNAIVIGMAAAGLPRDLRARAILVGILAATVLRIAFAALATRLLDVPGLLLAGGLLLLWICWKLWGDLREGPGAHAAGEAEGPRKTFGQAAWQIVVADVSMSLDNVLAVAGAAREHQAVLYAGLGLSILLMGLAASLVARVIDRFRWIAYLGLAVIVFVAGQMIRDGALDLRALATGAAAAAP